MAVVTPIILLVLLVLLVYLLWRIYHEQKEQSALIKAEIERLSPFFERGQGRCKRLVCKYSFLLDGQSYEGETIVPIDFFFRSAPAVTPFISYEATAQMPMLFHGGMRLVGEESIEAYLLQQESYLPVQYLVKSPDQNYAIHSESEVV